MFETMDTEALHISLTGPLSLHASGRTTGIVTDCGEGETPTLPVYEGSAIRDKGVYPSPRATVLKYDVSGKELSKMIESLKKHNIPDKDLTTVAREIKEKLCYVALDLEEEKKKCNAFPRDTERYFQLPDGRVITVGAERFQCPEILFIPSLCGIEMVGLHEIIHNTIRYCDSALRKELYANVVLAGGSSLFPGFLTRMKKELIALAPEGTEVNVDAPSNPKFSAWIGGSIIASHSNFKEICILREEYNEYGPKIVYTKCC